ncbi:MAG: SDR family NAD(P)-dependent oxidoreductase [Pseudolysinimonas sp.]
MTSDHAAADHRTTWDALPLSGYRTLVTGAASGIGRAIALGFAEAGADVAVVGSLRGGDRLQAVVAEVEARGRKAIGMSVDVSDDAAVGRIVQDAAERLGGLDTVVACAGVPAPSGLPATARLSDISAAQFREVLDVNVRGAWSTVRYAVPYLRRSSRSPSAITIASVAAKRPTHGAYSVSKAALWMATRVLAEELAEFSIRANCIAPGFIDTPLFRQSAIDASGTASERVAARVPLRRIGRPEEVASTAIFLASGLSAYFTGALLNPDGGHIGVNAGG